jgi:rhodanese-related sulfurtransferase
MIEFLLSQPILIALGIVVIFTIVLSLVLPLIARSFGSTKGQIFSHDLNKFIKDLRKHPIQTLVAVFLIVAVLAGVYYLYAKDQPVQISAASFVKAERAQLDRLQQETTSAGVLEASDELIIIDIRGIDFYREHIQGALGVDLITFRGGKQSIDPPRRVAVYTSADKLNEAKEVANSLKKQKMKKIYIIKDGYEALKASGLTIQENFAE